jgi:hypothetical protein
MGNLQRILHDNHRNSISFIYPHNGFRNPEISIETLTISTETSHVHTNLSIPVDPAQFPWKPSQHSRMPSHVNATDHSAESAWSVNCGCHWRQRFDDIAINYCCQRQLIIVNNDVSIEWRQWYVVAYSITLGLDLLLSKDTVRVASRQNNRTGW